MTLSAAFLVRSDFAWANSATAWAISGFFRFSHPMAPAVSAL